MVQDSDGVLVSGRTMHVAEIRLTGWFCAAGSHSVCIPPRRDTDARRDRAWTHDVLPL
ncbi:hypothetical protein AGR4B_pAt20366 [Agrobacterium tumefaciens str. CFBP 5621]|nr:hypothetical protein AGR4B_pAt20366 [Agrobacterium tumefaciens str. CFBP 5621]